MNISFESADVLKRHLQRHSICVESLKTLGANILQTLAEDHLSGKFSLITEGYGSSTKLRFSVYRGQRDNALIRNYFLRIPHDPETAAAQLVKESKALSVLNGYPAIYHPEKGEHKVVHRVGDRETEIDGGVFSWADDRYSRAMVSLNKIVVQIPEENFCREAFCQEIESQIQMLAEKLQGGQGVNAGQDKLNIKQGELPPDYWLEIDQLGNCIESPASTDSTNFQICDILTTERNKILCLSYERDEYWVVTSLDECVTSHIKGFLRLPKSLDWKPYHKMLQSGEFVTRDCEEGGNIYIGGIQENFKLALRHNDLHPGNIFVSSNKDLTSFDICFIDFCDADEHALLLTDFAFLSFTLCLAFEDRLKDRVTEICNLLDVKSNDSQTIGGNDILTSVFAAIKRAQNAVIASDPIDDSHVHFTYWYVAHRFLRYVLLGDRSQGYRKVVREWMQFWDPRNRSHDNLKASLKKYASSLAGNWENEKQRAHELEGARKIRDSRRLDCYVDPVLTWETGPFSDEPIFQYVEGNPEEQPLKAFERCKAEGNWLVITDGGGAGKSVLAMKLAADLSKVFDVDGQPYMVFFWESKLPRDRKGDLPRSLHECFQLDTRYSNCCKSDELIKYALTHSRVVVILDGYDELSEEDQSFFENGVSSTLPDDRDFLKNVHWVVTGRQYVFDSRITKLPVFESYRHLASKANFLRIEPFTEAQQDKYFSNAGIGREWRNVLKGISDEDKNRLVSLPQTLRSLLHLIELFKNSNKSSFPQIESGSDLFMQVFELSLEYELNKHPLPHACESGLRQAYKVVGLTIAFVAFRMARRGHFRAIEGRGSSRPDSEMERIIKGVKVIHKREKIAEALWQWAEQIIWRLVGNQPKIPSPLSPRVFAFQHRVLLEMHCANYLASYARDKELSAVRKHIGNPEWEYIWRAAIEMPLYNADRKLLQADRLFGADLAKYNLMLETLFQKPVPRTKTRRPSRLMYEALEWLNRKSVPRIVQSSLKAIASKLSKKLTLEFANVVNNGSEEQRRIASRLHKIDDKTKDSQFVYIPGSNGTVEQFYISRTPILNSEFQLFDPAHSEAGVQCKEPNMPATYCSYHDAYMFSIFVGKIDSADGQKVQASLPRPQQLMFCIRRLRNRLTNAAGEFQVPADIFCDFEAKDVKLTKWKAQDLGPIALFNSGFEWCLLEEIGPNGMGHPWPNEYYVVPGLRPKNVGFQNIVFRIVLNLSGI